MRLKPIVAVYSGVKLCKQLNRNVIIESSLFSSADGLYTAKQSGASSSSIRSWGKDESAVAFFARYFKFDVTLRFDDRFEEKWTMSKINSVE